jgi:lactate dehydrogenase-like 2-hydroxyacid dehydrogenase
MGSPEDFAMGDESKDYCRYCARPDGLMQSYEEKIESFTAFIVGTQGIEESLAREMVEDFMANLPAWKNHGPKG